MKRFGMAVAVAVVCAGILPESRAAEDSSLPLADCLRLLKDETSMANGATNRQVLASLANLSEEGRQQLLADLVPLLTNPPGGSRLWANCNAFAAVGPRALPVLVEALSSTNAKSPSFTILALTAFKSNAVPAVAPLLKQSDLALKQRALSILSAGPVAGSFQAPPSVLTDLLKSADPADRREGLKALAVYGTKAAGLRDDLLRLASQDADVSVRIFAVRLMGGWGADAAPSIPALAPLLQHPSLSLRAEVLEDFAKLGTNAATAAAAVEAVLADAKEDPYVRRLAAAALARMGQPGVEALAKGMGALDEETAYQAALALGSVDPALAVPAARARLAGDNLQARRFAAFALARQGPRAKEALADLVKAAADPAAPVRRNAIEALGRLGDDQGVAVCTAALKDKSADVARAAAGSLETLVTNAVQADSILAAYRQAVAWKPAKGSAKTFKLPAKELEKYEIGGPLAGLRLPLWQGQNGDIPGYPGSLPEKLAEGKTFTDMNNTYNEWGPQGTAPELELYPGAVEHYRNYMFKYYGARSFFDKQSQLQNWEAARLPGIDKALAGEYAEPVYYVPRHSNPTNTGAFRKPVSIVRCTVGKPVIKLDLGNLDAGLYVVRVIGAVENKAPRRFIEPLFMRFRVNDGLKGEVSDYRIRCGYVDQFYSIAEFYFHAVEKRQYTAEVVVDEGSKVDLLVHNLTLDDGLAGATRTDIKRQPVLVAAPAKVTFKSKLLAEERLAQDAEIWRAQPRMNAQGSGGYWPTRGGRTGGDAQSDVAVFGLDGMTEKQIADTYGSWQGSGRGDVILVNGELGLRYTMNEFQAGKALPDPYPFKDSGAGLYQPNPKDPDKGQVLVPIGDWVFNQRRAYGSPDTRPNADLWVKEGNSDAAREEAMRLIRLAWQLPSMDIANSLAAAACIPAAYGRDIRCRRRETYADYLSHYPNYIQPVVAYDKLFTYIDGNEELAASVSRFVPWVKNSRDVIQLMDVYLLQTIAKRVMRYHYATGPTEAGDAALLQDNRSLTEPWIDWLFSRTFVYPLKPAGLQNVMITGCDRSGPEYVGSAYYSQGEGAARTVESTERFREKGILPERYDLTRSDLYPKPLAHCYWHLGANVAGQEFLRVGDVTGADKSPGHILQDVAKGSAVNGWNWSHDPRFAWMIKNVLGRKDQDDKAWGEIEAAAATVSRAPWLDQPSRQVYNWAGVLESGRAHDDWRFHRAAYVRTGLGMGHQHSDSLDLQVVAHGLPMTMDAGQRNGYSTPASGMTRVHNLVEVDGRGHYAQSWVSALADASGARYMAVVAEPPNGTSLFRRQVALIDVDEGTGSQPLAVTQQLVRARLPAGVTTANSYVFDVFRVSGGTNHTYCFHGPVSDELVVNDEGRKPVVLAAEGVVPTLDQRYLAPFGVAKEALFAGDSPAVLSATWRYMREKGTGCEAQMAAPNFDPASPLKYTRLHLLDAAGLRVLQGAYNCHNNGYRLYNVFAQKRAKAEGESLESAFVALIEPYAGEPFITGRRTLAIAGNESDARRAVAVEVKTRNGHTDVLFADDRPEKVRTISDSGFQVAGKYACYSADARGLRVAALAGGTLLAGPELRLKPAAAAFSGVVTAVDYLRKTVMIDAEWPATLAGRICEIGTTNRTTSYGVTAAVAKKGTTAVTFDGGADYYQAVIDTLDASNGVATCAIKTALGKLPGLDRDFTASNEQMTKWWRADYLDDAQWKLSGAPVQAADFQPSRFLRVWEYGVGDKVTISTDAAVRRVADGVFEVTGSVAMNLALKARGLESSSDQKSWKPLKGSADGEWFAADITPATGGQPVYVRKTP